MFLLRALAVWLLIIVAESLHGTFRVLCLAPYLGDFRARQVSVFSGALLIFIITFLFIRWMAVPSAKTLLAVGACWVVLTAAFEVALGRLLLGYSWPRIGADYDVSRGNLMAFGLLFLMFAPLSAVKLRR